MLSSDDDSALGSELSLDSLLSELLDSELTLLLDDELLGAEELLSLETELLDDSELDEKEDSLDVLLEEDELLSELLNSELSDELLSLEIELLDDSELVDKEDSLLPLDDEETLLSLELELEESPLESELTLKSSGTMATMKTSARDAAAPGLPFLFSVRCLEANRLPSSFFIGCSSGPLLFKPSNLSLPISHAGQEARRQNLREWKFTAPLVYSSGFHTTILHKKSQAPPVRPKPFLLAVVQSATTAGHPSNKK